MAPYSNPTTSFEGPVPHTHLHIAKQLSNSNGTDVTMSTTSSSSITSTSTSTVFVVVTTVTSSPRTVIVFITPTPTPTRLSSSALTKANTKVLNNGAIIGIAVGGFSFIVLVLVLAILLWRYKRRREIQKVKYTPWSIINSGSPNGRTGTVATSRPSNAISEASMLEIPIPTPYLFDSPTSIPPRIDPFRGSPVDGRAILKSLVPHDYPVPQLLTQRIPSIYLDNAPMKMDGSTDASSPSVYEFDPDLDDLSHKAVDPHNNFITTKPRPLPIPLVLQPGISNRQPLHLRNPKILRIETGNEHSKYLEPHQMLKPPPTVLTRSRSREARAMAELIKAIDASSPSSQRRSSVVSSRHTSIQSEIDESVGIAVTTPFKSRSPYGYSNASSQSSMTNTILHRLTADFPLPPTSSILMDSNP